jgi:hypothetical protein
MPRHGQPPAATRTRRPPARSSPSARAAARFRHVVIEKGARDRAVTEELNLQTVRHVTAGIGGARRQARSPRGNGAVVTYTARGTSALMAGASLPRRTLASSTRPASQDPISVKLCAAGGPRSSPSPLSPPSPPSPPPPSKTRAARTTARMPSPATHKSSSTGTMTDKRRSPSTRQSPTRTTLTVRPVPSPRVSPPPPPVLARGHSCTALTVLAA